MANLSRQAEAEADAPRPTRLFKNGNSQAVRIPKALAFTSVDVEVEIQRRGDELIVRPTRCKLSGVGAALRRLGRSLCVAPIISCPIAVETAPARGGERRPANRL